MPIYQSFNNRINAWVKYKFDNSGFKVLDVKQQNPTKPFKKTPIKGRRKM